MLAATECSDVIESIVSSTKIPVLRLEFCPPSDVSGLKTERLQLYRLNASQFEPALSLVLYNIWIVVVCFKKETYRDNCASFVINKWLEERICSLSVDDKTKRMLLNNGALFRQDKSI